MNMVKRAVITIYSGPLDIFSHQVRIVLAEKGVTVDIVNHDTNHPSQELLELNPYGTTPTLVDRDLVLFDARVIMEYLEERFPHPPLLPVYPIARAKCRLLMHRMEKEWYPLISTIESGSEKAQEARQQLKSDLLSLNAALTDSPYLLSDDYTLVDCCMAPLLWRLPHLQVEIPKQAKNILQYRTRVFKRDAFQVSLSEAEREIRGQE